MISAKKDIRIFANCKQVKYYATDINESLLMYQHLRNVMIQRNKMFNEDGDEIMNIRDWNKKHPYKKLKEVIVASDEITFYMPTSFDSPEVVKAKEKCRDIMWEIYKEGRNCGIHIIACLQRPDQVSFPATMKALIGARICFYQPNTASSLTVIDTAEATNIRKQREAIVDGTEKVLMKTMYLTPEMIKKYITNSVESNHQYLNLGGQNKSKEEKKNTSNTEKQQNKDKSSKNKFKFDNKRVI
jgi:S-DNA-T family DNA segregation ATPase FtsK/SpoIIIE